MSQFKRHKALLSFLPHILPKQLGTEEKAGQWAVKKQLSSMASLQAMEIYSLETRFPCISAFLWTLLQKNLQQKN